jgi:hypothetical protein
MTLAITLAAQAIPAATQSLGRSTLRILEAHQQTRRQGFALEARHRHIEELCARAALLSGGFTEHQAALLEALGQERDPGLRALLLESLEALSAQEEGCFRQLLEGQEGPRRLR